jgi:hypothetical protein
MTTLLGFGTNVTAGFAVPVMAAGVLVSLAEFDCWHAAKAASAAHPSAHRIRCTAAP